LDKEVFAKTESIKFMTHGLHTLLEMETSLREQRKLILDIMVNQGIVGE
jgi:hypothetical protein